MPRIFFNAFIFGFFLLLNAFCTELSSDHKRENELILDSNDTVEEMVEIAEMIDTEFEKLYSILSENQSPKQSSNLTMIVEVPSFMAMVNGGNSIITLFDRLAPGVLPNVAGTKLANMIKQIKDILFTINKNIGAAVEKILYAIKRENFEKTVITPLKLIEDNVNAYLQYKTDNNKKLLKKSCETSNPREILSYMKANIKDLSDSAFLNGSYTDETFQNFQNMYNELILTASYVYPYCYFIQNSINLTNDDIASFELFLNNINDELKDINNARMVSYFDESVVVSVLEKLMWSEGDYDTISLKIRNYYEENYGETNQLNNYIYAVFIYHDLSGYNNHAIKGYNMRHLFRINNKNVVIIRDTPNSNTECDTSVVEFSLITSCGETLLPVASKLLDTYSNVHAVVVMVVNGFGYSSKIESKIAKWNIGFFSCGFMEDYLAVIFF